jgi:hypothetical protein
MRQSCAARHALVEENMNKVQSVFVNAPKKVNAATTQVSLMGANLPRKKSPRDVDFQMKTFSVIP